MAKFLKFLGIITLFLMPRGISWAASAQKNVTCLTFEHTDGTQSHFVLSDLPVLTFDADKIYIKSANADTSVDRSGISHFHFTSIDPSAVEDIVADDYSFSYADNVVIVRGGSADMLSVYDVEGRCVGSYSRSGGEIKADLSTMASGVYVVSVAGKASVKVLVKH